MTDENEDGRKMTRVYGETIEFEASVDIEAPPRDMECISRPDSVELESDIPGFMDGEYQPCSYCEGDSLVEVDHYEEHLREEHGVEP